MFPETQAGVRTLILNDLAQEVSPHSQEVLRQEVRIILPWTHVPLTQNIWALEPRSMKTKNEWNNSQTGSAFYLTGSRCRDGERSGENEVFSGREGEPSSPGTSPIPPSSSSSKEPLKVMPAPPPKENAWAKRSAATTGSCDGEGRPPVSPVSPSSSTPPKSRWEHSIYIGITRIK